MHGAEVFHQNGAHGHPDSEVIQMELYEQIGRLKLELEWVKKNLPTSPEAKRASIEPDHPQLSMRRQCAQPGFATSLGL